MLNYAALVEEQSLCTPNIRETLENHSKNVLRIGLPKKKEEWRTSDLSIFDQEYKVGLPFSYNVPEKFQNAHVIVLKNGVWDQSASKILPGIKVEKLSSFQDRKNLSFMEEFNHSLANQALKITVPENFNSEDPLIILHAHAGEKIIAASRHQLHLQNGAQLKFWEISAGTQSYFHNSTWDITCEKESSLHHCCWQDDDPQSIHYSSTQVHLKEKAFYRSFQGHLGAKISRQEITVNLLETHAKCELFGFYLLDQDQRSEHILNLNHLCDNTESEQLYKGILKDQSQALFQGKVTIEKKLRDIVAHQLNKNLLLSPKAKVYSWPQLEINTAHVECTHGSTLGRLSEKELFYLTSRGISPQRAKTLLTQAFLKEVVMAEDSYFRNTLEKVLENL